MIFLFNTFYIQNLIFLNIIRIVYYFWKNKRENARIFPATGPVVSPSQKHAYVIWTPWNPTVMY